MKDSIDIEPRQVDIDLESLVQDLINNQENVTSLYSFLYVTNRQRVLCTRTTTVHSVRSSILCARLISHLLLVSSQINVTVTCLYIVYKLTFPDATYSSRWARVNSK